MMSLTLRTTALTKYAVSALALLALGVGLNSTLPAFAQNKVPYAQTQAGMNETAGKIYAKADAEMNQAYKKLMAALDKQSQTKLRDSQLHWLKFRDAESEFLSLKFQGGSAYPMVYAGNKTSLTRKRTKELNETYKTFRSAGMM